MYKESFKKVIGVKSTSILALNGLIGTGIFFLPSILAKKSGLLSPFAFLVAGLLMLPIMLVLAQLSKTTDRTGGPIMYVANSIGKEMGVFTGWVQLFASFAGAAAAISMLTNTLGNYSIVEVLSPQYLVFGTIIFLTLAQVMSLRFAVLILSLFSVLKLIPIGSILFLGVSKSIPFESFPLSGESFSGAIFVAIYACLGAEASLVTAGETKNPKKNISKGFIFTYIGVVLLYVAIQYFCMVLNPQLSISKNPIMDTIAMYFGSEVGALIGTGILFSILGYIYAALVIGPRYAYTLSKLGALPEWVGRAHHRWNTPWLSILTYIVIVWFLSATQSFVVLVSLTVICKLLVYSLCIISSFLSSYKSTQKLKPHTLHIVALISSCFLLTRASFESILWTSAICLVYFFIRNFQNTFNSRLLRKV